MAKTAKEKELEKQMAEAKAKQAGEIAQVQIEVYEGQKYEAKSAYQEAKSKRGTARSKLPEEIPDDPYYKERLLEAQYIKANISSPSERQQVDDYTDEIKKQQKAKETIHVLDKQMPQLYASAVKESKSVESKAEKAKVAEEQRQTNLITGFQTQIITEQKRESKRLDDIQKAEQAKVLKLQQEAQARQEKADTFWAGMSSKSRGNFQKKIHYSQVGGVPFGVGDVNPHIVGKGIISLGIHQSYFDRVAEKHGITAQQAAMVSSTGARTQSGKEQEKAMRSVLDPSGKSEADYQASRAQAKRNVASAYGSMSAQEKLSSSAMASTYATSPEIKKADQLEALSDMTGGLLGKKKYQVTKGDTMRVYETDALGTRKDVTAEVMPIIQKQREIELANRRQQEYVKELRAGNIGTANALSSPQTTQSYTGISTVNLRTFLKERGLTAKTAPDSMFKPDYSEKLEKARTQAKVSGDMGDLRTQSGMFVGKPNQSYQMQKASGKEIGERKNAQRNIDVFKAQVFNTQKNEDSNAIRFTHLPDPTVGTIGMGKPNDVLEQKGQSYFGVTPHQIAQDKIYDYNVVSHAPVSFTTMGGKTFQAYTPVTFDTKKEADEYDKARPKEKVFSGTDNELFNKFQYASAVDSGEVIHPRETPSLTDDVRYYANVMNRPLINLGASVVNLTQDKQVPIYQTGAERLIGGTIDDTLEGQPLRGTGVTGLGKYIAEDPVRAGFELPAEAVMWIGGGWAVSAGVRGATTGVRIAGQVGSKIVQSNAPRIVTVPTMAVMGAGSAVKTGAQVIQKAPENIWLKGTEASTTLKGIDKSLAYVGGQRVGMGTAMNLRYTWQGRKLLKEARTTSRQVNQPVPLMEGKIFTMKRIEDPVVIKSKNVIEVPIKETDESIFHLRNIQQKAKVEKVGNVQQYYKSATPNFINVPRQGLSLPKAPKLPSLDPMRRWVAKTKSNVKLVEAKGYGAMLSGGKVKLKAVEKGMKVKDAKQIAQAEVEGQIRDAKLLTLRKKYQTEIKLKEGKENVITSTKKLFVDPVSRAKFTSNTWNKLSQIKATSKIRLREMKKGITDRPATEELILYREATETTATKSIARSTAEPLTESYTPIKTTVTQTKTPTDFTTGITKDPESLLRSKRFERKEVSMSVGKTQPNLEIVGEQVRIPFKDYRAIKAVDQANLDRLYEQGKYSVYEKGKLVEKKVEVRALQQEDVDKTLIQRNTLTGTGEKIQESSVREWGGTKKTLYGDVEVGGQKSDVILKSLNKKVLTTKLSPLPKPKKPSVVEQRQTSQTDDTAVWTGGSTSGNPMTGKGTTVPEFGGKSKPSAPEKTGTFNPDGTVTVNKSNIISSPVKGKAKEVMKDYSTTWKSTKSPYNSATVGSATIGGITIDTVSGLTPKDMIKTGVDTGVRIDTGIQGKIDTKVETGLKQDTVQKTLIKQKSRIKSKTGLKIDTGLKLDIGLKQKTAQISLMKLPVTVRTRTKPKMLPIILPRIDLEDKPAKRGKRGKKKGFIGNVRLDNIMGMYKRKEITYGAKKVKKLERQDMRLTAKTPNRISQPSSKLLKSKKKKKPKTETDFLGRVSLKSKSEFKGFSEKKIVKKKSKRKSKKKISLI